MDITKFAFIITLILFSYPVVGLLFGLKRGVAKSGLRLATVLAAALLSFILAPVIASQITVNVESILSLEYFKEILDYSPSLTQFIIGFAQALVAEIAFIVLYFVLSFVFYIIFIVLSLIIFRKKDKDEDGEEKKKYRILGALVGVVNGFVTSFVILVLFSGLLNFAETSYELFKDESFKDIEFAQTAVEIEEPIINMCNSSSAIKFFKFTKLYNGAVKIFDKISEVPIGDKDVPIFNEINMKIIPSIPNIMKLATIDFNNLGSGSIEDIKSTIESIANSEVTSQIATEYINNAATQIKESGELFGVNISESLNDPEVEELVNGIIDSLATTEDATEDLLVFTDIIDTFNQNGIMGEGIPEEEFADRLAEKVKDPEFSTELKEVIQGTSFEDLSSVLDKYLASVPAE